MTDIASRVDGLSPEKRALLVRIVRQTPDEMARLLEPEYWQETLADAVQALSSRVEVETDEWVRDEITLALESAVGRHGP